MYDHWLVRLLKIDPSDKKHILDNPRFYIGIAAVITGIILMVIGGFYL